MIIRFGILVCGLWFAIRILQINTNLRLFETNFFEKTLMINIFLTLSLSILNFHSLFFVWSLFFCSTAVTIVTIFVTAKKREREFRQDFVDYLDRVIAFVRSGNGILHALEAANTTTAPLNQKKIKKIIEMVQYSVQTQQKDPFLTEIIQELRWIHQFPGKTQRRLISFRKNLRIEDKFRRKSGRIFRQMMIQVGFLLLLYIAMFIFVGGYFGWKENLTVFLISFVLFFMGLLAFYYVGSKKLWKI